ncbi:MAG: hypothetical protein ACJZ12_03080 [Candidatus Neomarinimicrobiota bacterium]
MKTYIQGLITGGIFIFATFILMGAKDSENNNGRYQVIDSVSGGVDSDGSRRILVIDTTTGDCYKSKGTSYKGNLILWWKMSNIK